MSQTQEQQLAAALGGMFGPYLSWIISHQAEIAAIVAAVKAILSDLPGS